MFIAITTTLSKTTTNFNDLYKLYIVLEKHEKLYNNVKDAMYMHNFLKLNMLLKTII